MASREARFAGSTSSRAKDRRVRAVRGGHGTKPPRPSSVEDFFGGGEKGNLLKGEYNTPDVYAWFQNRHSKGTSFLDKDGYYRRNGHEWKVPYGVKQALTARLTVSQIANKYPFYVTWVSPKTGKRLKKYFMSLPHSLIFIAEKAQYVDEEACVVSRHGFFIPRKLMGKFPRRIAGRMHYWCPCCMAPRKFRRRGDETFFAQRKEWSNEKNRYVWKERQLAILECPFCHITNRAHLWRKSNQPVEIRKIKKGVRRIKARRNR